MHNMISYSCNRKNFTHSIDDLNQRWSVSGACTLKWKFWFFFMETSCPSAVKTHRKYLYNIGLLLCNLTKRRNVVHKILINQAYACAIYIEFGNKKHLNCNNNRLNKSTKGKRFTRNLITNHSVLAYSLQERHKQPQTYIDSIFVPILH